MNRINNLQCKQIARIMHDMENTFQTCKLFNSNVGVYKENKIDEKIPIQTISNLDTNL